MTRLFLVRHGPTHAKSFVGWSDLPADLSDTDQIARLNAHLPQNAHLVSSDLSRAVTTADAVGTGRTRLPHDPDLREIHFGAWELKRHDDIEDQEHLFRFWDDPGEIRAPGGETWHEVSTRVSTATDRLMADHPGRDLIIVAHFGAILTQVQRALQITAYEAFSHKIDNLSVTELHIGPQGWQVEAINHLP